MPRQTKKLSKKTMKHLAIMATFLLFFSGTLFAKHSYTKREVMIPMRDGVKLYTAIYTPKHTVQAPIVLLRTPYGCKPYGQEIPDQFNKDYWKEYLRKGYIIVFQDVRGRYQSEGTFIHLNPQEAQDSYDTAEWLTHNIPQSNGNIGVVGCSYGGFYAFMAGTSGHKAIKIVSPQAPVTDWWQGDDMHHNGAFCPTAGGFLDYMQYGESEDDQSATEPINQTQYGEYLAYGTIAKLTEHLNEKRPNDFWNEMVSHPNYDEWWQQRDTRRYIPQLSVQAVLVTGGTFDGEDYYGTIELYNAIRQQRTDIDCRLVIGPWTHGGWRKYTRKLGAWKFSCIGSPAKDYIRTVEIPMMEQYLRDGKATEQTDHFFITGSNLWTTHPMHRPTLQLYLHADNTLSPLLPKYGETTYISDPANPVPSNEARNDSKDYMYADQSFLRDRNDVVSFTTTPFASDFTLRGEAIAHLAIKINTEDADFFVKIIDVSPKGEQLMVRSEMLRARYRNGNTAIPIPLDTTQINEFDIRLLPFNHTFKRGHRLMVQIQSSAFPLFDRNPQSFVDIYTCQPSDFKTSTIALQHTEKHNCYILLPH